MARVDVTLPNEGSGSFEWWDTQLKWAAETRHEFIPEWRANVAAYRDKVQAPTKDAVRVNIDYEKTEQKRHQLFYRLPEVRLKPHPRTVRESQTVDPATKQPRDLKKAVRIWREALQQKIGKHGANLKATLDQEIIDVLVPAGIAACRVGYERTEDGKIPIQTGTHEVPMEGRQALGLQTTTQPVMGEAPNVIHERYDAPRISPGDLLIPPDFMGRDYAREADWLGREGDIERHVAIRLGWPIPEDLKGSEVDDQTRRLVPLDRPGQRKTQLHYKEVFYYAARILSTVKHPEKIHHLVFVDGMETPAVSEEYKDQRFDARGRFISGLRTLPIKVLALHYVSDYPFPPSDCSISRRQSDELSQFRSQGVIHRKKSVPMRWINIDHLAGGMVDEGVMELIKRGEYDDTVPTHGDGSRLMGEIARATYPRENMEIAATMMGDVNRQWALGANASGERERGRTTATEISTIAQATQDRASAEQGMVVDHFLDIVEGISNLMQLYADRDDVVELVGEAGAAALEVWNRDTVPGELLFSIMPNSAAKPDAAAERDLALNEYNLLLNNPFANQEQLYRDVVEVFGHDPDRLTKQPEPPQPEKPRISLSVKAEDLWTAKVHYPNLHAMLTAAGLEGLQPPEEPQPGEPPTNGNQPQPVAGQPPEPIGPAPVVDRERLRMATADEGPQRTGGLPPVQ